MVFLFFLFPIFLFFHLPDLLLLPIIIIIMTTMGTKKQQRWAKRLNLATVARNLFVLQRTTGADGEEFWEMRRNKRKTEELRSVVYESWWALLLCHHPEIKASGHNSSSSSSRKREDTHKHSDTEKDRGTEKRGFCKRGKSSERRKVYLVWEEAFGFVGFMIRLQVVRASERAASDGEFWVFFFCSISPALLLLLLRDFFFLFVEERCFGGGRGGVTSTHSLTHLWVVMLFLCFVLCFFPSPRPSIH